MKTKKHPILDLIVNENGTLLIFKGKELSIKTYKPSRYNYIIKQVNFGGRTQGVAKLVCETWNGMRDDFSQSLHRKDKDPSNDHYTNLYWDIRGKVRTIRTKRNKLSQIKKSELPTIIKRIVAGETLKNIANNYNTSDMSISRIKKRFVTDPKMKLKEAVMAAKNKYQRSQAYANYLGFKTQSEAISNYGKYKFQLLINKIAITL